jgi:HK97 family phage major capsid protein
VLRITDPGAGQATEAERAEVTLEAEEIAAIVPVPEAVVDDSAIDRWTEIREGLAEAAAHTLGAAVFRGTAHEPRRGPASCESWTMARRPP